MIVIDTQVIKKRKEKKDKTQMFLKNIYSSATLFIKWLKYLFFA